MLSAYDGFTRGKNEAMGKGSKCWGGRNLGTWKNQLLKKSCSENLEAALLLSTLCLKHPSPFQPALHLCCFSMRATPRCSSQWFDCLPACLHSFARLLGVFKLCENPGSWWCQTSWVIWRLAAWEGFIESSLAYIKQFNLSFCVTQVVGSELFRGRRIYSLAKGGSRAPIKGGFIPKTPTIPGIQQISCIQRMPKRQGGFREICRTRWIWTETWIAVCFPLFCWIGWTAWKMVNDHLDQLQAFSCVVCHNSWFWSGKKTNSRRAKKGAEFDGVGCTFVCHFPRGRHFCRHPVEGESCLTAWMF